MTYKTNIYRWVGDDDTGHEEVLEVEGSVSAVDQGRYSGPPERCYPAEGGDVEIESVRRLSPEPVEILDADYLTVDETESAVEALSLEAAEDDSYDGPEYECDE